jgi:hypothetical protein
MPQLDLILSWLCDSNAQEQYSWRLKSPSSADWRRNSTRLESEKSVKSGVGAMPTRSKGLVCGGGFTGPRN